MITMNFVLIKPYYIRKLRILYITSLLILKSHMKFKNVSEMNATKVSEQYCSQINVEITILTKVFPFCQGYNFTKNFWSRFYDLLTKFYFVCPVKIIAKNYFITHNDFFVLIVNPIWSTYCNFVIDEFFCYSALLDRCNLFLICIQGNIKTHLW